MIANGIAIMMVMHVEAWFQVLPKHHLYHMYLLYPQLQALLHLHPIILVVKPTFTDVYQVQARRGVAPVVVV